MLRIELLYRILFLGDREHQLKGSFSRKPATTRQSKFNPKKFSSFFFIEKFMLLLAPIEKKKKVRTNSDSADFFQEPESLSEKLDKKTKPGPSARNKEKATTQNPPSAKIRGKTNAESRSTETGDSPEPAAKRPIVASERKTISAEEPATSSTEHVDKGILNNYFACFQNSSSSFLKLNSFFL
jgi:hypothetical protein